MHRRLALSTLLAGAAALAAAAPPALAASYTYAPASAKGYYFSDEGVVFNTNDGQNLPVGDGSNFQFVTCVGSDPGQPACSAIPGFEELDAWYKWPALPTSAAAHAFAPDFGITKARAWSSGTAGVGTGAPGYTQYAAAANAGWHEEITTTSLVPITITFVMALHATWNDGGILAFQMGRPGAYNPDVGAGTPMLGRTWANCTVGVDCAFGFDTGNANSLLPGGANGFVDQIITLDFVVNPASFADPEDPNPYTNPREAILIAAAAANDAETEGYSTATLQAILAPPNAGLSFASGHAYNVQVVPEPVSWAMWALGLAALLTARRRARRAHRQRMMKSTPEVIFSGGW